MLYVDPRFARRGVGATLIDALVRLAAARGAKRLTSEVSDTARPLFERQGFVAQRRNLVQLDDRMAGEHDHDQAPCGAAAPTRLRRRATEDEP